MERPACVARWSMETISTDHYRGVAYYRKSRPHHYPLNHRERSPCSEIYPDQNDSLVIIPTKKA